MSNAILEEKAVWKGWSYPVDADVALTAFLDLERKGCVTANEKTDYIMAHPKQYPEVWEYLNRVDTEKVVLYFQRSIVHKMMCQLEIEATIPESGEIVYSTRAFRAVQPKGEGVLTIESISEKDEIGEQFSSITRKFISPFDEFANLLRYCRVHDIECDSYKAMLEKRLKGYLTEMKAW